MKRAFAILLICLPAACCRSKAQVVFSADKWMEYVEELAAETEGGQGAESLYNDLSYRSEHPFELNRATAGDLQSLPFLSDTQIGGVLAYRKRYGGMASIYELKNIEELDFRSIELLLPFVYIGEQTVEKLPLTVDNFVNYGKSELQIGYRRCLQQKQGYRRQPDSLLAAYPNRQYLGEAFYHSLRYSHALDERLQLGLIAEKDAGEPFANKHHKGYDFYSFHLVLKDLACLRTVAAGDYKASFGQGLALSNDFSPGKYANAAQAEKRTNGFRPHFSTGEHDFFSGIASTAQWDKVALSLFYSYRKLDAALTDSSGVSSIPTDGLHRLPREREKRSRLPMQTYGGNIRYAAPRFCLGFTALSYSFGDYRIMPDEKPYNLFYFRGNRNLNLSVDYLLRNRFLKFYGETAVSANKAPATLNALQLTPVSFFSFLLLHRYYDIKYQAYFGNAFSQNTMVQNEQGAYLGLQFTPLAWWNVSAGADFFRFPWLRYEADAPSAGREYVVQVDYTQMENASFSLRCKYKQREKNQSLPNGKTAVLPYEQYRLRLQMQYRLQSVLLKTSADGVLHSESEGQSLGFLMAQSVGWQPEGLPFQADLYAAYFRTDNYDTRLSTYERNLLYAFYTSQVYGEGVRLSARLRWDLPGRLSLFAKLDGTHHPGSPTTGAGPEEIEGSLKTELSLLLRWKF